MLNSILAVWASQAVAFSRQNSGEVGDVGGSKTGSVGSVGEIE